MPLFISQALGQYGGAGLVPISVVLINLPMYVLSFFEIPKGAKENLGVL